ncbi:hypothetical protein HKX48_002687 [Thoreauomyces humboldtii]|nr:hypothetical protein HKX48_002687 [Thoreauomyces humboldtii]
MVARRLATTIPLVVPQLPSLPVASLALRAKLDALPTLPTSPLALSTAPVASLIRQRLEELRKREEIVQRSPEWHDARRLLITASEATAFLPRNETTLEDYYAEYNVPTDLHHYDAEFALSPFANAASIFGRKLGTPGRRQKGKNTTATRWGVAFEPVALSIYERLTNRRIEGFGLLSHETHPWLGASVDGVEVDTGVVVEIKCPLRQLQEEPEDHDPPEPHYWVQVQLQMETLALPSAVLFTTKNGALTSILPSPGQCNFVEYADVDDFSSDTISPRLRGCMLVRTSRTPAPYPDAPSTLYPPSHLLVLDSDSPAQPELQEWVENTLTATCVTVSMDDGEEGEEIRTYRPRYWYLASHVRKEVRRNRVWFEKVRPTLEEAHAELLDLLEQERDEDA